MEQNEEKGWAISIGLYPGFLLGMRSYVEKDYVTHVIYFPFFDIAIMVDK